MFLYLNKSGISPSALNVILNWNTRLKSFNDGLLLLKDCTSLVVAISPQPVHSPSALKVSPKIFVLFERPLLPARRIL